MNQHARYGIAFAVALAAGASGCTNASAQMPTTPARTLTADTDVNQLVSGTLTVVTTTGQVGLPAYEKVADGAFVLTDAWSSSGAFFYALASGKDCSLPPGTPSVVLDGTNGRAVGPLDNTNGLHGARVSIKSTEELCATWSPGAEGTTYLSWSGFKPY
jgi:hypothetical protein